MTSSSRPVFMLPGLSGDPADLSGLAERLIDLGVNAISLPPAPAPASTVEAFAVAALSVIRARQPRGPYRLFGYSFGGLVAIEIAERLAADGERVEQLWLADPFYDRRWWPASTFVWAQLRRAGHHLRAIARRSPRDAARELARCGRSLVARLAARGSIGASVIPTDEGDPEVRAAAAMAAWRPRRWPGATTMIAAWPGLEFGCDVARLWTSFLPRLSVERVEAGGHRDLLRSSSSIDAVAGLILRDLSSPPAPRAAVVTRYRWLTTARVALDLADAGFEVVALSPRGHAVAAMPFVSRALRLPWRTKAAAARLASLAPDLVVPCDDAAAMLLHAIAAGSGADAKTREVLAQSLGGGDLTRLYSRSGVLAAANRAGIACATQVAVENPKEAGAFAAAHDGRTVVKADGSWGGRGVVVAHDPAAAAAAAARLGRPPGTIRMAKRLLVDQDLPMASDWLRRRRPPVSIQGFVVGREGNIAAACWRGELLASVGVEVSRTRHANGPATQVEVVEHPGMIQAARRLCAELGLSGLFGLDFMIDDDGRAWLIELNPRATPTMHLRPAAGPALAIALRRRLDGEDVKEQHQRPENGQVVLFPHGLSRDFGQQTASPFSDVPWHAPELVEQGLALAASRTSRDQRVRAG